MNATDIPPGTYIEIKNGIDETPEMGVYPVWIATIRTPEARCDRGHTHWTTVAIKHQTVTELQRLIKEKLHEIHGTERH